MDLSHYIYSEITKCVEKVRERFPQLNEAVFPFPVIEYKNLGKTAGYAYKSHKIELNYILLRENITEFITRTIPHEMAHLVVYKLWPGAKGHGIEWRHVCRELGMEDITRCHKYDVTNSKRKTKKFAVQCRCREYLVGPVRMRKIQAGISYTCKQCKQRVSPV